MSSSTKHLEEALRRCPTKVLAAVLGVTEETVRQRARAGVFTQVGRGKFDLVAAAKAEREFQEAGRRAPVVGIETARLKRAQAERAEMENAERARSLLPAEDVRLFLSEAAVILVGMLDGAASRMAAALAAESDPGRVRQIIQDEHRAIRETTAARLEALGARCGAGEHPPAAAASDAGPVGGRQPRAAGRKPRARSVAKP